VSPGRSGWAEVARTGEWTSFVGLPAPLTEAELLRGLDRPAGPHARRPALLGSHQADLVDIDGVRYWLDGDSVVLVELLDPPSALPPAALVAALGDPERTGAGRHRRFGATTTEHVYPRRGLALTIAESYDEPPGFEPFLAAVQLFAAGELRTFVLDLGGDDRGGPRW
jgi:hypothetical protein